MRRLVNVIGVSGVIYAATRRSPTWTSGTIEEGKKDKKKPWLQLHFDIDKTLIVSDPVSGKDTPAMVNSIISEVVWGKVDPHTGEWTCISRHPSTVSPEPDDSSVMTFGEYLENVKFRREEIRGYMDDHKAEPIKKANAAKKAQAAKLKTHFTEPGQIGEQFHGDFENLMSYLEVPPEVKKLDDHNIFKDGRYAILPSFFHLLVHLQKEQRDFSITFRTFGTEIEEVAREFNLFCEGKHPLFPHARADGSEGTLDRRLDTKQHIGAFRLSDAICECANTLFLQTMVPNLNEDEDQGYFAVSGWHPIGRILNRTNNTTWALRDSYSFWANDNESDTSGKVLLVRHWNLDTHPIFFDDNIERDRAHIVNVKRLDRRPQYAPFPFAQTKGKYLVKAEPFLAITDENYFIKALAECEEARKKKNK